jgi:Cellulase (glycosyl hydrolase family 5)
MKARVTQWGKIVGLAVVGLLLVLGVLVLFLAQKEKPQRITYGMSFNTPYAIELGLDWRQTYDAILDDLGVRHLRLAAHWDMVQASNASEYNFEALDYQVARAEEVGATVVFAVGRRLPRWPECHVPTWAKELSEAERQEALIRYIETTVTRYKDSPAITVWQVENEPFLEVFAFEHCGELDRAFLDREIALVRSLDATRPILVTDSGNLGTWIGAYSRGDMFGTSVYVHFWNPELGQFRTFLPPWFYRVKDNTMALLYGRKPSVLIELSAEPWLLEPIVEVPIETQFTRMNLQKFEDIITYAEGTHYEKQYLWGAEWWYWLKQHDKPEMWERGKRLFVNETPE